MISGSAPPRLVRVRELMGTAISVHVIGDPTDAEAADDAIEACFDELAEIDRIFSTYRPDSDISRLTRAEITMTDADPRLDEVASACAHAEAATAGRFTAWWSGCFDPTGYVKGWAVEQAARRFLAPLVHATRIHAVGINAGGDMQLFTAPASPWRWNVGIADPTRPDQVGARIEVRDGAVATSGSAERGQHIIDPRTGAPVIGDVISATVVADTLSVADVWATAAVVSGMGDLSWITDAGTRSGLLIGNDGAVRRWREGVEVVVRPAGSTDELPGIPCDSAS